MSRKWVVVSKGADFNKIAADFNISPYLARIIRNRGAVTYDEIDMFLNGDISKMHDPALLPDMDEAAQILTDAIQAGVRMRVVGDYDIDGVCASYILKKGIESAGGIVDVTLPERIKDGYGINENIIRAAYDDGIELIITCDNGIAAAKETDLALSLGMSMIITDHHEVPYEERDGEKEYLLPQADAVIDPKRADCDYPFDGICGAMVAYKLISYLYTETEAGNAVSDREELLTEFLSFAAFATVGDIMELRDENRIAVRYGLDILKNTKNTGMRALIEAAHLTGKPLSVYHIGFVLGPCINATGRLESADAALELFFETDEERARERARSLVSVNESRKNMTIAYTDQAISLVTEKYAKDKVLVVYMPECHESLAGIVAGRLREHFYRPSIVLTNDSEGNIKGSGRSIEGYSMFDELGKVKDMFTKFGGHKMAAGLSMKAGLADALREAMNDKCTLTDDDLVEKMKIDIPLPIGYIDDALVSELDRLEPCGVANPRPLFAEKDVIIRSISLAGKNNNVVKFTLEGKTATGGRKIINAVCFDDAEKVYEQLKDRDRVSILYQAGFNEYEGRRSVQLVIKDYM
ncbi:MAG: single-stranded-DNA-specific exonuclease RecJ [Lachnospiraceae bacterium]|nr:single-stranded-DNA-specific exonuclease RecJ [Lachnospiraceae bacterium]